LSYAPVIISKFQLPYKGKVTNKYGLSKIEEAQKIN